MNMSKSEKCAHFRHIFANNFFGVHLKKSFNGCEITVKFCIFLYLPFSNFEAKRAQHLEDVHILEVVKKIQGVARKLVL
jgi:hypothetical protein